MNKLSIYFHLPTLLLFYSAAYSQVTVGLMNYQPGNQNGYLLFTPTNYPSTYLINKCGDTVHAWSHSGIGQTAYLAPDGYLYRSVFTNNPYFSSGGGITGKIEKVGWNSNVSWSYTLSDTANAIHHDFKVMPNGNILVIVWKKKDKLDTYNAGRDTINYTKRLWTEQIIELQPTGVNTANVVWKWDLWDHLIQDIDFSRNNFGVVTQHPELVNINYIGPFGSLTDWIHLNSVEYNPNLDQILLSSRIFNEIWIIDHSTTTSQAASHSGGKSGKGGDLLYRWGNPKAYNRGTISDQQFFGQHNARWILPGYPGQGNITVFNNGVNRPAGSYSTVDEIQTPVDLAGNYTLASNQPFGPLSPASMYTAAVPTSFFSNHISGALRLKNGNTMMLTGANGIFTEVDSLKNIIWKYKNPVDGNGPVSQGSSIFTNAVFNFSFLDTNYLGLSGHNLTPGKPIELNPVPSPCDSLGTSVHEANKIECTFQNPNDGNFELRLSGIKHGKIEICNTLGEIIYTKPIGYSQPSVMLNISTAPNGIYFLMVKTEGGIVTKKVMKE